MVAVSEAAIDLPKGVQRPRFAWLEITGKCQLACKHCYAGSSPQGDHGTMELRDWKRVISELAGVGVRDVQFIGGEPTLHPDFTELVHHALSFGLTVEVFSNLARKIRTELWEIFELEGVRVATSYYSDSAAQHEEITKGKGSHKRTRNSIQEAVKRGVQLRVGLIDLDDGQRVQKAREELVGLGVAPEAIGYDRLRGVGRGTDTIQVSNPVDQFCGQCVQGVIAVFPDGHVAPCVFSRVESFAVGNVKVSSFSEILSGQAYYDVTEDMAKQFTKAGKLRCGPWGCNPEGQLCGPDAKVSGCDPTHTCQPDSTCQPFWKAEAECVPNACGPTFECGPNESVEAKCEPSWCSPTGACDPHTKMEDCLPHCAPMETCAPPCAPSVVACDPSPCGPDLCSPNAPKAEHRCEPWCTPGGACGPCIPNTCRP